MSEQIDPTLQRLKDGICRFQTETYPKSSDRYRVAGTTPQKPHALIVTCADSRVNAETITSSGPGEIFAARNVGNLVPVYGEMLGGVSAVVEYAVEALKVKHIVVCGHTDCGAMKGLEAHDSVLDAMPTVKHWLANATEAKTMAQATATLSDGGPYSLQTLTEQNVLLQLKHLQTHPSVRVGMALKQLTISGWIYDISSGDVMIYDPQTKIWESTLQKNAPERFDEPSENGTKASAA